MLPLTVVPVPAVLAVGSMYQQWALLGLLFLIALAFGVGNVVMSHMLGPARHGQVKESTYESGVDPRGGTKERFNVRFYLVAMIFVVFDVEVLFLIPWLSAFNHAGHPGLKLGQSGQLGPPGPGALFVSVLIFAGILLLAYGYAWAKGVFKWD